jgi:hypothetical protein
MMTYAQLEMLEAGEWTRHSDDCPMPKEDHAGATNPKSAATDLSGSNQRVDAP